MNFKGYLKDLILTIIHFCTIVIIMNITLISSTPIAQSISDIVYLNILIFSVSLFFLLIGYRKWKEDYKELYNSLDKGEDIDLVILKSNKLETKLIKDIIDFKNRESYKESKKLKDDLHEINEYITKWVHEIKIPISVCELIADKIEDNFNDSSHISSSLRCELERTKFLVEQVLYAGRASSYSEDLLINEVNIKKVVSEIIKKNSFFFISKDIELELDNIDYTVMTDEKWIGYILEQIINNACKYVNKNGIIQIYGEENEKAIMLNIKDNGIGILPKDIERIFDKGFTGDNGRKVAKSTGMGLYFSKKMAQKLNHDIKVASQEGKNTTFTIVFYKLSDYYTLH